MSIREVHVLEPHASEICSIEIRAADAGLRKYCFREVRIGEIRAPHACARKVNADQLGVLKFVSVRSESRSFTLGSFVENPARFSLGASVAKEALVRSDQ